MTTLTSNSRYIWVAILLTFMCACTSKPLKPAKPVVKPGAGTSAKPLPPAPPPAPTSNHCLSDKAGSAVHENCF
ncbi:MAG: hypothetical protein V4588_11005 [Pseudomonadota bacterium]